MEGHHHALIQEFPELKEKIHTLKMSNAHFAKLCDRYEEVDKAVVRAESRIDLLGEDAENALRQERVTLKDEIYSMLNQ